MSCGQQGIARLQFSLFVSIKDRSLYMTLGKSPIYCPERILGYGRREDLLLSCSGYLGGGGPCTALSPGLRSGGLESKFGRGPAHPEQEGDGLVLLVPRVQAGRVFSGYPARDIDSRIAVESVRLALTLASQ